MKMYQNGMSSFFLGNNLFDVMGLVPTFKCIKLNNYMQYTVYLTGCVNSSYTHMLTKFIYYCRHLVRH